MPDDTQSRSFPVLLEMQKRQVALALPSHMNADRMARIALTAFRQNPTLGKCDPLSVFASVIQSSQTGLEIGVLGQAFLVPYYDKTKRQYICQFIPGWKGLVDLVNRAGNASVWTGAVFNGDQFDYALGDRPFVLHKPAGEDDPAKLTHVYAIGRVKGAEWPVIEVWSIEKVIRHRDRYNKVGDAHYSYKNIEMYARKVPLLQVLKYMPASPELARAIKMDDAGEMGRQRFDDVSGAIDGDFVPMPEGDEERKPDVQGPQEKPAAATAPTGSEQSAAPAPAAPVSSTAPDAAAERVDNAPAAGVAQHPAAASVSPAPPSDDPRGPGYITAGGLNMLRSKAKSSGKTAGDVCHHFDVDNLRDLTIEKANQALEWLRTFNA